MSVSNELVTAADRLFSFLVERFPVMCSSDEFYFLPRIRQHDRSFAAVESLDPDRINDTISWLKTFRSTIKSTPTENDLEHIIDKQLLNSCISGILIELEERKSWSYNPLFYLKTVFIGLEQALRAPPERGYDTAERVKNRLRAIPDLLGQAEINIYTVPESYHHASISMIHDCIDYLNDLKDLNLNDDFEIHLSEAGAALISLRDYLTSSVKREPDYRFNTLSLEATMRNHFQTSRSLNEVFEIGLEEWEDTCTSLRNITREIGTAGSWKELYTSYRPIDSERTDTLTLYRKETEKLQTFFQEREFGWVDTPSPLDVVETPAYLRSVRGSASFSASMNPREGERDLFYITTEKTRNKNSFSHSIMRVHREYKFLSAHEAFPGHYLLDSVRRNLQNPIRRLIESPLFYEGWAYYSESLLEEDGYIRTPIERLVHRKRTLWRAGRCMIDSGLPIGQIDREKAVKLMEEVGYPRDEAAELINRFQLNPGYHLCYTLGRFEILNLRKLYGTLAGRESFHRILLKGGELPFHLIEKRFQALIGGREN